MKKQNIMQKLSILLMTILIVTTFFSCTKGHDLVLLPQSEVSEIPMNHAPGHNGNGNNQNNETNQNTTLATPSPTFIVVGSTVTVSWGAVSNSVGYQVVFSDDPANTEDLAGTKTTALFLVRENVPNGTYTVKIRALKPSNDFSSSPFSATVSFTVVVVIVKTKLATPSLTTVVGCSLASVGAVTVDPAFIWPPNNKMRNVVFSGTTSTGTGNVNVSWSNVSNAAGYTLAFGNNQATSASSPWTMSNLAPGTYTVSVVAKADVNSALYLDSDPVNVTFTVLSGSATYTLVDEYGIYTSSGTLSATYSISLMLQASRLGQDKDGRSYTFTATATNGCGVSTTGTAVSIVPHDQR